MTDQNPDIAKAAIPESGDGEIHTTRHQAEIIRDTTFSRSVADEAIVLHLGRDTELSFLQMGQTPASKYSITNDEGAEEEEGFELRPVITEVARVRLGNMPALFTALSIIDTLVQSGIVNKDSLAKSFERILEKFDHLEDAEAESE